MRTNTEVKTMYVKSTLVHKIKSRRSRWLEHILIVPHNRMAKKVLHAEVGGKKTSGRPKERWYQQAKADIEKIGVSDRKNRAKVEMERAG